MTKRQRQIDKTTKQQNDRKTNEKTTKQQKDKRQNDKTTVTLLFKAPLVAIGAQETKFSKFDFFCGMHLK